jgi:hypothetical protein
MAAASALILTERGEVTTFGTALSCQPLAMELNNNMSQ